MRDDSKVETGLLADVAATEAAGQALARQARPGDLFLLQGPLGAGKTTLVRGLVAGLGGDPTEVGSPTFVLLTHYQIPGGDIRRVYHVDLYRVRGGAHAFAEEIGLDEVMDDPAAVTAVEWPEVWDWRAPGRVIRVRLEFAGTQRRITVTW